MKHDIKTQFSHKITQRRGLFRSKDKQLVSIDKPTMRECPKSSLIESGNSSKKSKLQSHISSEEECLIRMSFSNKY